MLIQKYATGTFILKDLNRELDLNILNKVIIKYLKTNSELDQNDTGVERAIRYKNYIIICGYGSVTDNILLTIIKIVLCDCGINLELGELSDIEIDSIKDILPIKSLRNGSQCGGITRDASTIDPYVEPLSNALNTYKGVKTFSSCEGHLKNDTATIYVLFTIDTMENLNVLSFQLWHALENVVKKYPGLPSYKLIFDYGHWPNTLSTYFELRLVYNEKQRNDVFELTSFLANLLEKRK
jgi:hypothetical protein